MNINPTYNSVYNTASMGIQRGMQGLDRNAAQVASTSQLQGKSDPGQALVESKIDSTAVRANAKVLAAADDTIGTLLNVMA